MTDDIIDRLRKHLPTFEDCIEAADEIERLQKYQQLVQFIANDYHELSHDKAYWQRDDWKKRCKELMGEEE